MVMFLVPRLHDLPKKWRGVLDRNPIVVVQVIENE
jgi:hypothetical protein